MSMRLIIEVVLVMIIVSLVAVIIYQDTKISSLEYRADTFEKQSGYFAKEIRDLKVYLTVACAYRNPIDSGIVNWSKVCGGT